MDNFVLPSIFQYYNLVGSLLAVSLIAVISKVGKWMLFKHPALAEMRRINREIGAWCNGIFFLLLLPFCITLQAQPVWKILLDIFVILMFYDFFYYLAHRFWFHGNGTMRQVHAVHHQARNPTYLDAHYVHPKETFVGLALFMGCTIVLAALMGPFHLVTIVVTYLVFFQLNQINHTFVDLPYFPFKTLSWITAKHHVHHENMHKGNYATITLLYDRIFGTLD